MKLFYGKPEVLLGHMASAAKASVADIDAITQERHAVVNFLVNFIASLHSQGYRFDSVQFLKDAGVWSDCERFSIMPRNLD